jgi:AcrR family transcriptional regulator
MSRRERGELSRTEVIATALRLVDTAGLRACTVRALAHDLRVAPMAIYWHVPGKEELLNAILDAVFAEVSLADLPDNPMQALATLAHRYRQAFARHPHTAPLLASHVPPTLPVAAQLGAKTFELLGAIGLTEPDLTCAYLLLNEFMMGTVISEFADRPQLAGPQPTGQWPDPDTRFEFGLSCMLAGLRERTTPPHPPDHTAPDHTGRS